MRKSHKDNDNIGNQANHENRDNCDNRDNRDNCVNHDIRNIVGRINYFLFLDGPSSSIVFFLCWLWSVNHSRFIRTYKYFIKSY